jgi:Dolichyl-phosphate-mannose-protein mannosyltransferase
LPDALVSERRPASPAVRRAQWLGVITRRRHVAFGLVVAVLAASVSGVAWGDETYLSLQGDMARHMMNGVFFLDLVRDRPFGSVAEALDYARHYFARYPALSLGHHPVLIGLLEAPLFALFGISVATARLLSIASMATAAVYTYRLVADLFDDWAGVVAALVLVCCPVFVELSQGVMSEPTALALIMAAAFYAHRFAVTERRGPLVASVLLAAASIWAKQLTVFALPGLAFYVWWRLGWRRLLRRDVLLAALAAAIVILPIVPLTLVLSAHNVRAVSGQFEAAGLADRLDVGRQALRVALAGQLGLPLVGAALAGLALLAYRRHVAISLLVPWIVAVGVFVAWVTAALEPERYGLYWVPAWGALVGALVARPRVVPMWLSGVAIGTALLLQMTAAPLKRLPGAGGYEQVAQYVVGQPRGDTVLFAGDVDSGYFTFFVRKHDEARRTVVLRADKVLTIGHMGRVDVAARVANPDEMRAVLRKLGVGYVVVESGPSSSRVFNWLQDDVQTAAYVERLRVPVATTERRLRGRDLVVYEVVGAGPAAADARLDIQLPLIGSEIDVAVSDLAARKYLR